MKASVHGAELVFANVHILADHHRSVTGDIDAAARCSVAARAQAIVLQHQ